MFALECQRSICLMMQVSGVSEVERTDWCWLSEEVVISGTAKLNIVSVWKSAKQKGHITVFVIGITHESF